MSSVMYDIISAFASILLLDPFYYFTGIFVTCAVVGLIFFIVKGGVR